MKDRPTVEDIVRYSNDKGLGLTRDEATDIWEYYENAGWRLSGGRGAVMKDWRLAVNRWARRSRKERTASCGGGRQAEMKDPKVLAELDRARRILAQRRASR